MELLFFVDLPVILHFESCHEYSMNFIFATFLADDLDVMGSMPGIRLPVEVYG